MVVHSSGLLDNGCCLRLFLSENHFFHFCASFTLGLPLKYGPVSILR